MVFPFEKPKCANPKCNNPAFIKFGEKFYCGDCVVKLNQALNNKNEMIINEALNGLT